MLRLRKCCFLAAILSIASVAAAKVEYTITDLGTLGGTRSEAQRLLPGLEERNPELLCDAHSLCLVFLFDRLLEVKTYCTGPECWEEGWINQDALDRLKEWERETPEVLASTQDGKWKTTWRAKDGLLMHRETNWSHHLGRGENGWVAHRGLLCVAVALGKKKVDEDAPLSCP